MYELLMVGGVLFGASLIFLTAGIIVTHLNSKSNNKKGWGVVKFPCDIQYSDSVGECCKRRLDGSKAEAWYLLFVLVVIISGGLLLWLRVY